MASDELYPPVAYSALWLVLGLVLLLAIVVWYIGVFWFTRGANADISPPDGNPW